MAERANTGNTMLDAWINAFHTLMPEASVPGGAGSNATSTTPPPFQWERIFLGASEYALPFNFPNAGAVPRAMELWGDLAQRSIGVIAALGSSAKAGDPLGEALEQSFGVAGDVGGSAAEGPAVLAELTKATSFLYAARERYQAFILATWQRAFEEVTREAARRSSEGQPVLTPAQWLALSNSVADRVFVEAFHSQTYLDAQHQLSSALADQRRSEMKLVELFARFGHFPTRRALDDVSAEVSELRRRVRQLERVNRGASVKRRRKERSADER